MEILWILLGFVIGALVAWLFLGARHRAALAKQEAEASKANGKLAAAQSETRDLRSKLAAEASARLEIEDKMLAQKDAGAAAAGDDSTARLRRLESELRARDQEIAALQAEPARVMQRDIGPSAAAVEPASSTAQRHTEGVTGVVESDDLTRIKGIGPVLQEKLRRQGITAFRQIAEFTAADIQRVNGVLDFPGRIEREKWVEQARNFIRR